MNEDNPLDFEPTLRGLQPGQQVFGQRYSLTKIIGRGGMGMVWLARDTELDTDVALKFLPEFVAMDKAALDELKEETKRSLTLTHPNIVRIHTFHSEEVIAAIAMEYIDGQTLSELRIDQPNKVFEVQDNHFQRLLGQLCAAMAYAHASCQVVHRDLKPANLMVNQAGDLKVTDFGIARSLNESMTRLSRAPGGGTSGTLSYMSPQQALGERATISDDIYAFGASLYELLTSKPPFYSGDIYHQICERKPPPIAERRRELEIDSTAKIPAAWENVIAACLEKDPAARPKSIAEIAKKLGLKENLPVAAASPKKSPSSGIPPASRRKRRAPLVLTLLFLLLGTVGAGGYWWFFLEEPKRVRWDELVVQGHGQLSRGELLEAAQQAELVLSESPGHPPALELRNAVAEKVETQTATLLAGAESAIRIKDYLTGLEKLEAILDIDPDHLHARKEIERLGRVRCDLQVQTSPPGVSVSLLDREEKGVSPVTFENVPVGIHRLRLSRKGYETSEEAIRAASESTVLVERKLVRSRGGLEIASEPSGMTTRVSALSSEADDTQDLRYNKEGVTPLALENLPTGDYEVVISRPNWPDAVFKKTVKAGNTQSLSHIFGEGSIRFDSGLSGVKIFENGKQLGTTPLQLASVPSGPHHYEARYEDWPPLKLPVEIGRGKETVLDGINWPRGKLKLSSIPPGATFWRGKQRLGIGPLELELPVGPYDLEARFPALKDTSFQAVVEAGKTLEKPVQLPCGELRITTEPEGIAVYDQNRKLGHTPFVRDYFPSGSYQFILKQIGYQPKSINVLVGEGQRGVVETRVERHPVLVQALKRKFLTVNRQNATAPINDDNERPWAQHTSSISGFRVSVDNERLKLDFDVRVDNRATRSGWTFKTSGKKHLWMTFHVEWSLTLEQLEQQILEGLAILEGGEDKATILTEDGYLRLCPAKVKITNFSSNEFDKPSGLDHEAYNPIYRSMNGSFYGIFHLSLKTGKLAYYSPGLSYSIWGMDKFTVEP